MDQPVQAPEASPGVIPAARRVVALDVMKGLLIAGMVLSHLDSGLFLDIPLFSPDKWLLRITIFPGLVFIFGFVTFKSYLEKPALPRKHILVSFAKILGAYLLSGVAYLALEEKIFSLKSLLGLLRLDYLPYFTEYLLTFALLLVLLLVIPRFFRWIPTRDVVFWPVVAGLLLTSLVDFSQVRSPYLALLVGSEKILAYPLVQHLPFFLLGIYFAHRQVRFSGRFLAGAVVGLAAFLVARQFEAVSRFPPSFFWITGSLGAVYLCYLFAMILSRSIFVQRTFADIGRHTLFWLVLSNTIIYSLVKTVEHLDLPAHWIAFILLGSFFSIAFLGTLTRK